MQSIESDLNVHIGYQKGDLVMWTKTDGGQLMVGVVRDLHGDDLLELESAEATEHFLNRDDATYLWSILHEFPGTDVDKAQVSVLGEFQCRAWDGGGYVYSHRVFIYPTEAKYAVYGDPLRVLRIQNEVERLVLRLYEKMVQ